MTSINDTEVRSCYRIQGIIDASENVRVEYILFCHAFTGCDTISAFHMFENIVHQFYLEDMFVEDIRNATIHFFELLYSASSTLQ